MLVFRSPSVQITIKEFLFTKDTVDWGKRWRSDERILFRQFGLGSIQPIRGSSLLLVLALDLRGFFFPSPEITILKCN